MLCPYCLQDVTFKLGSRSASAAALSDEVDEGGAATREAVSLDRGNAAYRCPNPKCNEIVPNMYVKDYHRYPPLVASAVGFSGHGKTVYFASLMHTLRHEELSEHWPDFYSLALDDPSLKAVIDNMQMLEGGDCPVPSPRNFPRPTLLRLSGVPGLRKATLSVYDTSGEAFETGEGIQRYARYLAHAKTVLFLASIPELVHQERSGRIAKRMHYMLESYISGVVELGGDPSQQNLVVVFTKADILASYLDHPEWQDLREYINSNGFDGLDNLTAYLQRVNAISTKLEDFTKRGLKARTFVTTARENFKSVSFCMISALGAKPIEKTNKLSVQVAPRRVLDPLLLILAANSEHAIDWENQDTISSGGLLPAIMRLFGKG